MSYKSTLNISRFLEIPQVREAVDKVSKAAAERKQYKPPVCQALANKFTFLQETNEHSFKKHIEAREKLPDIIDNKVLKIVGNDSADEALQANFRKKRNIGVVFSGGPAPGGHNVIAGIFDSAKKANQDTKIFGFLMGPDGIIENHAVEITAELVNKYRNTGGFTMIKTGRTKIDNSQKIELSRETCKKLELDALVLIGGDDSNTNAALLAQKLFKDNIQVIGVPKTIDGDIQVKDAAGKILCAVSFGFHSAARSFAENIANLCTDCSSDVKYWHVCKVMGRVASHLALETALQTHANITLIGEELADYVDEDRIKKAEKKGIVDYTAYGMTLRHLSRIICKGIVKRAAAGKNYGILIIPEGVLEFINEIQTFIIKLNTIIAQYNSAHDKDFHSSFPLLDDKLEYLHRLARLSREEDTFSVWNTRDDDLFSDIPEFFQEGLLTERDSHGNFQFSLVETEKVLIGLVKDYLDILEERGEYKVGISRQYYDENLKKEGLDPDFFGKIIFRNYDTSDKFLLLKKRIISQKTLKSFLIENKALKENDSLPEIISKIYKMSVPKFKTQLHFYGYDGRGTDPARFDCNYGYNLGLIVFSLIAGGATGQMAAVKNLEHDFSKWQPIGIPIAPLMHLEERKGKLELVLEKSIVDINSPAFFAVKALREKWLAADCEDDYRKPGPIRFSGTTEEDRPITLFLNSLIS